MKIAMVSPYSLTKPGGVQGQVFGLSKSLRAMGHQVAIVGLADEGGTMPPDGGRDVFVYGSSTAVRSNGSVAPITLSPLAAARAERFVRRGGFDVVHIHEPLAPLGAYGLVLTHPVPTVGTYHRAGVSRWVPILKPMAALVGSRMECRVAVSEAARQTGMRSGGGAFEVLFNGVDIERFASAVPEIDSLGRPTVLFLGRHEPRKGLDVLLDAFDAIARTAVLWIAGHEPAPEVLRRHPESDRLQWLGILSEPEVTSRLAGADVLCAPSLHGESFGMVLLEGMAARCAIVASDIEGYRAAAGSFAALVPPNDVPALSRALEIALADVAEGNGRSSPAALQAALLHAERWSMDHLAKRYLELYELAMEGYAAGRTRESVRLRQKESGAS